MFEGSDVAVGVESPALVLAAKIIAMPINSTLQTGTRHGMTV
jgi:hypothetical protein